LFRGFRGHNFGHRFHGKSLTLGSAAMSMTYIRLGR
jgi:hypothetical protein